MKARFVTRLPEPRFYTCKMRRCGMFQYGLKPGFRRKLDERPVWAVIAACPKRR